MTDFRKKRRPDGTPYTHPIGSSQSDIEAKAREIAGDMRVSNRPGEAAEHQAGMRCSPSADCDTCERTGSVTTINPPVNPINIVFGAGGAGASGPGVSPSPSPAPVPIPRASMSEDGTPVVIGFPMHFEGGLDEVETQLQGRDDVAKVKVGGIRKKHIDVTTAGGEKYRFNRSADRSGGIHWRRNPPKAEKDEHDDTDTDSGDSGEGDDGNLHLWD